MLIDTSALLAVILQEEDAAKYRAKIELATVRRISAASVTEAYVSLVRKKGYEAGFEVDALLIMLGLEVVDFTEEHARLAWSACARYGKGSHPAELNLGDCMTYAVAKQTGEPLLFKGNDFSKTDLLLA